MSKIQIFDPAWCCPSGLCGPSIDPELLRMYFVVYNLKQRDFPIERFNLTNDVDQFLNNEKVNTLLNEKGPDVLPIILLDEEVVLIGKYPSNEDLEKWTGISVSELIKKPKVRITAEAQIAEEKQREEAKIAAK